MADIHNDLQIFVVTNERSTFPYVLKGIEQQTVDNLGVIVIKNMKWVDALNNIVDRCTTKYFIRCDDDFFLHPCAVQFIFDGMIEQENAIMGCYKLWEDWSDRVSGGVKIYNTSRVRKLGGFEENHRGSVDGKFSKKIKKSKYNETGNKMSVLGIHARATLEEMMQYEKIWNEKVGKVFTKWKPDKKTTKQMKKYTKTVEEQFDMCIPLLRKINKSRHSDFFKAIKRWEK
ncbi:MAG TPA: glycosyltransferase family A protein [Candidatus Glassbacteria bacterium]|nr:glycosyltransferase family A protein [Candidatus Glassbacteria bacterium]